MGSKSLGLRSSCRAYGLSMKKSERLSAVFLPRAAVFLLRASDFRDRAAKFRLRAADFCLRARECQPRASEFEPSLRSLYEKVRASPSDSGVRAEPTVFL